MLRGNPIHSSMLNFLIQITFDYLAREKLLHYSFINLTSSDRFCTCPSFFHPVPKVKPHNPMFSDCFCSCALYLQLLLRSCIIKEGRILFEGQLCFIEKGDN